MHWLHFSHFSCDLHVDPFLDAIFSLLVGENFPRGVLRIVAVQRRLHKVNKLLPPFLANEVFDGLSPNELRPAKNVKPMSHT